MEQEKQKSVVPPEGQQKRIESETGYTAEAVTILASPKMLYEFWSDPRNFKEFSHQLKSVTVLSDSKSHWEWEILKQKRTVSWDAEIVERIPDQMLSWRTNFNSNIQMSGRVEFIELPFNRGTIVQVKIGYDIPGGKLTAAIETLLGESPHRNLKLFLVRLRQKIETGELSTVQGQSAGDHRTQETSTALH